MKALALVALVALVAAILAAVLTFRRPGTVQPGTPVRESAEPPAAGAETVRAVEPLPDPARPAPEPVPVAVPGAMIRGVVRSAGERPAEGLRVRIVRDGVPVGATVETDEEGRFEIRAESEAGSRLRIEGRTAEGMRALPKLSAPIREGETWVALSVFAAASIRGHVLGPDGVPVEGVPLEARRRNLRHSPSEYRARSGPHGEFDLPVPPGQTLDVLAVPETTDDTGRAWPPSVVWKVAAGRDDLEIRLREGGEMRGRVIGADGKPVAGLPLLVRPSLGTFRWDYRARTDDGGFFRVRGVFEESPYSIALDERRHGAEPGILTGGTRIVGGARDLELTLHEAGCLEGKITRASGEPLARWLFDYAHDELPFTRRSKTKKDGSFAVDRVPVGTDHLRVKIESPHSTGAYETHRLGPVSTGEKGVVLQAPF